MFMILLFIFPFFQCALNSPSIERSPATLPAVCATSPAHAAPKTMNLFHVQGVHWVLRVKRRMTMFRILPIGSAAALLSSHSSRNDGEVRRCQS